MQTSKSPSIAIPIACFMLLIGYIHGYEVPAPPTNAVELPKRVASNRYQDPYPYSGGEEPLMRRNSLRDIFSVNVPAFYDMVKDGSSLGINVLSGLVRVERGREAERSGLTGPQPLSVRVFGFPVFERGTRIRPISADRPEVAPEAPTDFGGEEPKAEEP